MPISLVFVSGFNCLSVFELNMDLVMQTVSCVYYAVGSAMWELHWLPIEYCIKVEIGLPLFVTHNGCCPSLHVYILSRDIWCVATHFINSSALLSSQTTSFHIPGKNLATEHSQLLV